jgi:hypothetical protein
VEDLESIQSAGAELVVFFNATLELVDSWRSKDEKIPEHLLVVADERATVYDALGTERKGNYVSLARGSLGPALTSALHGRLPRATGADMLRLGADVAVRADGEITQLHLASTPDDRVPLTQLLTSLP